MTLKALIFDVDGTLAETEEVHRQAFNETFAEAGLDWSWSRDDYAWLLKTTGGKERMKAYRAHLGLSRPSDAEIAALHKVKTARYAEIIARGEIALRPGVAELIAAARAKGLKLAVATTTNRPNVDALAQACWGRHAEEVFDVIAAGDEVDRKKPAPDVFTLALMRLSLPAHECLAFEDSRNGVFSAQAAGLRVVVTPSAYTGCEDFSMAEKIMPALDLSLLEEKVPSRTSA
ncbi:HAD family hydrolase [Celeribacter neptunius]|uniref:Haloacid dehalogenase superfamily, subfamily IA, variant 3 with third motif having DD or ED n=1 Tax=Celeribacter neptunius TaxID=588602 RepID=A0A1I3PNS8_9RHOB|nr:HAD family hydrolase [Celeribacter neptunius]SFJ22676.1 haloacid dehalogenase superfamily, subfamily IA, variant 3 with third motif having DD or ED [Celeribacter neptunius]